MFEKYIDVVNKHLILYYLIHIYQNILICIKFYTNMKKIHTYLYKFKKYLEFSLDAMNYVSINCDKLTHYTDFSESLNKKMLVLKRLTSEINRITPLNFSNGIKKLGEIGHIMYTFYQLYDNNEINDAILYSFGFNGYFNMMYELKSNVDNLKMNKADFIRNDIRNDIKNEFRKPKFKKMYYPRFCIDC